MNIGLFGGTFDPFHLGHTALARAAMERFQLARVYFVPASVPPHKQTQPSASFFHRYVMVVLATMGEKRFRPSLLEAPGTALSEVSGKKLRTGHNIPAANYTIDTVRRLQPALRKADRLFFLIGIDAFNDVAKWHEAEALLRECEFIVASRPGYSLADIANALPETLRPKAEVTKPFSRQPAKGDLVLPGVTIHLLENVHQNISATAIREAVAAKRALTRFLDPAVAEYIKKMDLYNGHSS
jgi:nicotinate-nucleotide adenylyltransferase